MLVSITNPNVISKKNGANIIVGMTGASSKLQIEHVKRFFQILDNIVIAISSRIIMDKYRCF